MRGFLFFSTFLALLAGCEGVKVLVGDTSAGTESGQIGSGDSGGDTNEDSAGQTDDSGSDDTGSSHKTDEDRDGYDVSADCDDQDASVNPGAYEIAIVSGDIDDKCADGIDNDCNGLADSRDWPCQNDDEDVESAHGVNIPNGIDMIWAEDNDEDGGFDTLYVRANALILAAPWNAEDAVIVGDAWGGFDTLDLTTDNDGDGTPDNVVGLEDFPGDESVGRPDIEAWKIGLASYGLRAGNWNFTLVSTLAADGVSDALSMCVATSDATTWQLIDLATFCAATGDPWCRVWSGHDGCERDIDEVVRVTVLADGSIEPYSG